MGMQAFEGKPKCSRNTMCMGGQGPNDFNANTCTSSIRWRPQVGAHHSV